MSNRQREIIGRAEKVRFPTLDNLKLHARIDTGAKTSSIWALEVLEQDGKLRVTFPDENGKAFSTCWFNNYHIVQVSSSMGHIQRRFRVKIPVVIKKRRILTWFSLSDRSSQVYPVLIGRSALMRKFVVDVARGSILKEKELERSRSLDNF